MKHFLISLLLCIAAAAGCAVRAADKNPDVYTIDSTSHDFGSIGDSKPVSHTFTVTNTGSLPMIITTVTNGGCGCTTPKWTREPIAPGKTGQITITFSPKGRRGEFDRQVRARIETAKKKYTAKLNFSGVVVPSSK